MRKRRLTELLLLFAIGGCTQDSAPQTKSTPASAPIIFPDSGSDAIKAIEAVQSDVNHWIEEDCRNDPDARDPKYHFFCGRWLGKTPADRARAEQEYQAYLAIERPRWAKAHGFEYPK